MLLEWRLAVELKERGMISKIYPVLVGDHLTIEGNVYSDYFKDGCHPRIVDDVVVKSIEEKLCDHLTNQGLACLITRAWG